MVNISTAVRGHYDNDRYIWAIIIRRFCDRWQKEEGRHQKEEVSQLRLYEC
jgi:hypothetical protein